MSYNTCNNPRQKWAAFHTYFNRMNNTPIKTENRRNEIQYICILCTKRYLENTVIENKVKYTIQTTLDKNANNNNKQNVNNREHKELGVIHLYKQKYEIPRFLE